MTTWKKFKFFVSKKLSLFASSFLNTFYSARYLMFGTTPPYDDDEVFSSSDSTSGGSDSEQNPGKLDNDGNLHSGANMRNDESKMGKYSSETMKNAANESLAAQN